MNITIIKNEEEIHIEIDGKTIQINDIDCIVIGNIYNLYEIEETKETEEKNTNEEKIIELYKKYKDELYYKLNGEYALIIVDKGEIKLIRDRLGTKHIYYTKIGNKFVCSTNLRNIINEFKEELEIDKQVLANYLCYCYINEPLTIFKNVYKVSSGSVVKYDQRVEETKYYDIVEEYQKNKNKIKKIEEAEGILEKQLKNAIESRVKGKEKIGVFFSAGIDSTLITALCKEQSGKNLKTYTIGFYEKERNEAIQAKEIAKYLKTDHHEFYLDANKAKEIIQKIPQIYGEPFADPSMIPILFLYENIKDTDIILTGDGADQLFCGSSVYDDFNMKRKIERTVNNIIRILRYKIINKQWISDIYTNKRAVTKMFYNIIPNTYNNIKIKNTKSQIKYMLFDIKTFLSNRLFTKVSVPALYYNKQIKYPFIDNDLVKKTLQMNHKFKYHKKQKKYILKKILYKKVPQTLYSDKKRGFGIPLEKWIYTIFYEDIIRYSNKERLEEQGLFNTNKIEKVIKKLKKKKLKSEEINVMFSYYMFQKWYDENIYK